MIPMSSNCNADSIVMYVDLVSVIMAMYHMFGQVLACTNSLQVTVDFTMQC